MKPVLNVTVMYGGRSEEREVSLQSGEAVVKALRALGHTVTGLDPRDEEWELPKATEVVFLALHGTYGEDGTVQARLEGMGVPYTGCGVEASRVAFDKVTTKKRCLAAGIATPRYRVLKRRVSSWPMGWKPPVVLKPVRQGSSVGMQFVDRVADWSGALEEAFRHDGQVLLEERIVGRETTVGILGEEILPVVEVRPKEGCYDYKNKYTAGATEYFCPAPLDAETTRRVQEAGLGAFQAVGGRDYGRVDVMIDPGGNPYVLEVNTLPGMTETSLLPKAAGAVGIDYVGLCQRMVDLALSRGKGFAKDPHGA